MLEPDLIQLLQGRVEVVQGPIEIDGCDQLLELSPIEWAVEAVVSRTMAAAVAFWTERISSGAVSDCSSGLLWGVDGASDKGLPNVDDSDTAHTRCPPDVAGVTPRERNEVRLA